MFAAETIDALDIASPRETHAALVDAAAAAASTCSARSR